MEGSMKRTVSALVVLLMTTAMAFALGGQQAAPTGGAQRITVEVFDRGSDGGRSQAHNNAWTQWIQDKVRRDLNIEVTFIPVGRWSENTDIINLMASGSAPDLCYTYNNAMIDTFRDQGGVLNLSPLIDRLLPDMKRLLGDDPAKPGTEFIYRQRLDDGRQFSVQSYVTRLSQNNVFIRKDWLDRLGLPLPRTTQEYHDALVAFRDRYPGNVGRTRVIPFLTGSDARWSFLSIIYPYWGPNLSDRDRWIYGFGDRWVQMPGYKEGLRMMNQWYNEGLIYRDFPLLTVSDDANNIIKSGIVGSFSGNWDLPWRTDGNIADTLAQNVPGAEFVPIDAIQSPYDGITHKRISDKAGLFIFVPSFSRNQEAALRYLNWLCLYENFHFLQVGTQGVNHEIVNGVPRTLAMPAGHAWFMNSPNNIDYTMPMNGVEMGNQDLNGRVLAFGYGNTSPDIIVNANNVSVINGRAPVIYVAQETQYGIYGQVLSDKADALIAQATIASVADFDRVWDAGMSDYMSSGAQAIIDERSRLWPASRR
jgi:putative aldouronate transport system substrate-binding protein